MLENPEQIRNMVEERKRGYMPSPECDQGCSPCYMDCAVCRLVMRERLRDIERLLRERPRLDPSRTAEWRRDLEETQAHVAELQLTIERLRPKVPQTEAPQARALSAIPVALLH